MSASTSPSMWKKSKTPAGRSRPGQHVWQVFLALQESGNRRQVEIRPGFFSPIKKPRPEGWFSATHERVAHLIEECWDISEHQSSQPIHAPAVFHHASSGNHIADG